jgi:hypothetical protein
MDTPRNRRFVHWYNSVLAVSREAFLADTLYTPLWAKFPNLVVSNYGSGHSDGGTASSSTPDFGWHFDRGRNCGTPDKELVRLAPRQGRDESVWGAFHLAGTVTQDPGRREPNGQVGAGRTLAAPTWDANVTYATLANKGSALRLSSPVLYVVTPDQMYTTANNGTYNPYIPSGAEQPREDQTVWDASMRRHRMGLETVIDSFGGAQQALISPWVPVPGRGGLDPYQPHVTSTGDIRRLLMLLRHKQTPDVQVFLGGDMSYYDDHNVSGLIEFRPHQFRRILHEVYRPRVENWVDLNAPLTYPPGTPLQQTGANIERINDTLKRSGQPYEVALTCTTLDPAQSTSLRVDFANVTTDTEGPVNPSTGQPIQLDAPISLRLTWETRTNYAAAKGHVYLWNWSTAAWDEQYVNDDGPNTMTGFEYSTPDNSTRREIIVCGGAATYVDAGKVRVRIDHSHTLTGWGDPRLSAWHDLVQVSLDDLSACGGTIGGGTQGRSSGSSSGGEGDPEARFAVQSGPKGADHNSDGEVSLDDIAAFMDDYNAGLLIADYSGDDRVNADDLQRFTALYTQGR